MKSRRFFLTILLFIGLCHSVSQATSCTERGRFPNDDSPDCRGYVMCLTGGITNFTQYKLTCPQGSIYSHLEQQCTNATNYKCYPTFNCSSVSNFLLPESQNCSFYVSCVQGISGMATARLIECPPNTIFNSTVGECVDQSLSTCYTSIVNPVIHKPLETPIIVNNEHENNQSDSNVNHHKSNSAVFSKVTYELIIFICFVILFK